jgi:peptidoglycan/LPS O-acetylase OafA/YrhL
LSTATAPPIGAASGAPSPAVAPPPGNPRFALFDSLRAIAALAVLVFHVSSTTGALNNGTFGDVLTMLSRGLILFFVISGFLLYRPYVAARAAGRPRPRTSRYARRRVLRIVPAYWVALTVLAIFPGIVGVFSADWWRYYLFLQAYSQDTFGGGIPVAWTLCVEVAFYVSLPLWAMAVGRLRLGSGPRAWLWGESAALALLAAGGIGVQIAGARQVISMLVSESLLGQSTWFALGMALAVASVVSERSERQSRARRAVVAHSGLCWIGAAASLIGLALVLQPDGLLGVAQALGEKQSITRTLAGIAMTATLIGLLVVPAVFGEGSGGFPRRLLGWAPLAWLGLISYGIYLWHLTVTQLLAFPADPQHFSASGLELATKIEQATTPILLALTIAITSVLAAISYYVVELPFLRRKER